MPHEQQERYSSLVLAKIRQDLLLKDGVVFNNDYEGNPKAGAVKIPVRDTEVAVSDYDKLNGINVTHGSTTYTTLVIDKDKAVNELIDGYDAATVPDKLVADRLDSAGYALARTLDIDGGSSLISGGTVTNIDALTSSTVYDAVVDIREKMTRANIPNDGKRYLLVTPSIYSLILKDKDNFIRQSDMAQNIKATGAVGQYAGFNLYEWNDSTANLAMIAGHPRFATRVNEWKEDVKIQDLSGSGKYIGASAVQGRMIYAHKVLRSNAILVVYMPTSLTLSQVYASGKSKITVSQSATNSFVYRINPTERAIYDEDFSNLATTLESGVTEITCPKNAIIEVIDLDADKKCKAVGYITVV